MAIIGTLDLIALIVAQAECHQARSGVIENVLRNGKLANLGRATKQIGWGSLPNYRRLTKYGLSDVKFDQPLCSSELFDPRIVPKDFHAGCPKALIAIDGRQHCEVLKRNKMLTHAGIAA
jgi:hypothetical protein